MLLWRLFGGGDGNVSACKENVVCVLRIWEDEGAVMESLVCFCGKEDRRDGEGGRRRRETRRRRRERRRGRAAVSGRMALLVWTTFVSGVPNFGHYS